MAGVTSPLLADETDVYIRGCKTPDAACKRVDRFANSQRHDGIIFALDQLTFFGPNAQHTSALRADIGGWANAIALLAAGTSVPVFVWTNADERLLDARNTELAGVLRDVQDSHEWRRPVPAPQWMAGVLASVPCKRPLLVLVTDIVFPEDSLRTDSGEAWQKALLPEGTYFPEERVAKLLRAKGAALLVIAPEARFGDFLPFVELPDVPWASRPIVPGWRARKADVERRLNEVRSAAKGMSEAEESIRAQLEEALKDKIPNEEERRRFIDERVQRFFDFKKEEPASAQLRPLRFDSLPPAFCRRFGRRLFHVTDIPSGYGYWPLARAAYASGGRYLFYPNKEAKWLDRCRYSGTVMRKRQPSLAVASSKLRRNQYNSLMDAVAGACRQLLEVTPWSDCLEHAGGRRATSWVSFDPGGGLPKRLRLRDKPWNEGGRIKWGIRRGRAVSHQEYAEDLLAGSATYDRAIRRLRVVYRRGLSSAGLRASHPRAVPNLRLLLFWLEMSAFHLEAQAIAYENPSGFGLDVAGESKGQTEWLKALPAIQLSDCVDGLATAVLTPEEEASLPVQARRHPAGQGCFLDLLETDRRYRARRDLERVLKHLQPRLRPRALRLIRAAEEVMKHDAQTPWGCVVYYSVAYTFVFDPENKLSAPPVKESNRDREGDVTTPPSDSGGGSTPGSGR